ncbi:TusE/DsrC/DsvC family sulfur relay protein [Bowmanella sp. JS7-9]|uniref:Sulfurtransferase n=1 Tax=Pseudobowmanella zhangzhouensis TaxID=1537679 RepID=A0ABW1XLC9_9ALTE|nr:TusE/DsrC/DsvC family sulfur relay protein [Bowmanella sp. JS7-9]TBX26006.1 sulfur transfer protein TusE [Bowmanella sp. JS7-9]
MQYFVEFNGQSFETDKLGYLLDHTQWSPELGTYMASLDNIELDEQRWEVINFVRHFYLEFETSPAIRALVKAMEKKYGPEKGNSRYLYKLFPLGPAKLVSKYAGLPKPKKCL